jgi:hypothetical protein
MSEFTFDQLQAYKAFMNAAKQLRQDAFDAGWMIVENGERDYGMVNLEAINKELDKKQGDMV